MDLTEAEDTRVHQESNPEIPVPPGDEHYVLETSLDKVSFALQ